MQSYLTRVRDYSLVSKNLPLIYNLNIIENIALIKEVHENLSVAQAQNLAIEALELVSYGEIAKKRANSCSSMEIFFAMFLRALMTQEPNIIIEMRYNLVENLQDIETVLQKISLFSDKKNIIVLDISDKKNHYKGYRCNMIR